MVAAVSSGVARTLSALDSIRRAVLRRLGRLAVVGALRRQATLRLTLVALSSIAVAFVLAVTVTVPLLALSPVLLGVPHLASDLRYLVARRQPAVLPARAWLPMSALFVLSLGLGVAGEPRWALLAAWAAVIVAGLSTATPWAARGLFLAVAAALGALALRRPHEVAVLVAQGHNLVAIGLAAWLVRARLRSGWLMAAALAAGIAAIGLGLCDPLLATGGGAWRDALASVVPGGASPLAARRWIAIFAFAQAVHYGAWLRWVPDGARAGARPPSFRRSFALLVGDLGKPATAAVIALALALPLAACVSLDGARRTYVGLSLWHGFLELAFLACLWLRRR